MSIWSSRMRRANRSAGQPVVMIKGPGEGAGVIDIGEGMAVVFKIESHNHPSAVEPYQGAATGVGGIIRDVLAGEPSILLRPEIYVTAAALAAGLFVLLTWVGMPLLIAAIIGGTAGFALRAMAIVKGWAIPSYKG